MTMDIFEHAMKMEQDGEKYYRDLAGTCKIQGLKKILNLMADDEVDHYNVLKLMKEKSAGKLAGTAVLSNAKNIFQQMKDNKETLDTEGSGVDLYKQAIEVEKNSEKYYLDKAEEVSNDDYKKILIQMADEEKRHAALLSNMVEFLSRPASWVENAEFSKLEDY